jgi:hypothetical protein
MPLSEMSRPRQHLGFRLDPMKQTNSFLSMKVLLIGVRRTMDVLGRYEAKWLLEKHSSVEENGECILDLCLCPSDFPITSYSVLPALSLEEGILHCDIIEGSFDGGLFYNFISHLLDQMQPYPAPNSVIVMDNCRIHKNSQITDLIESRYIINTSYYCNLSNYPKGYAV